MKPTTQELFVRKTESRMCKLPEYLLIQTFLSLLCCIVLAISWHSESYCAAQLYPICVLQGLHFIWVLWSWRQVTGDYFSPYTLFFIAVQFFNGGECLLEIFYLNGDGILGKSVQIVPISLINKGVMLVTTGMVCLHLGALLGAYHRLTKEINRAPTRTNTDGQEKKFIKILGWTSFTIGIVPKMFITVTSLKASVAGGYMALYQGEPLHAGNSLMYLAASLCIPGSLLLLAAYSDRKRMGTFFLCFIAVLCALLLITGDRGTMAMLFLAALWLFHRKIFALSPKLFMVGAMAAFLVCPLVAHMRLQSGLDRFLPNKALEQVLAGPNPIVASMKEMGTSLRTVPYTMMVVPEKRSHQWGSGYLWVATTVVPNLFWAEHPASKHTDYGQWLTRTVHPKMAAAGGGVGFSLFAEMYMNFSWFGTPFVCILLGYAIGIFSAIPGYRAGPLYYGTAAILISRLPYFARDTSQGLVKPIFWFCILPYFAFWLWMFYKKNLPQDQQTEIELSL